MAKTWRNETWEWPAFVDRCRHTKRTGETVAEYKAMTKSQQAERKDVGGFVGGFLTEGKRKNGCVKYRSMITLDIDFAEDGIWEKFTGRYKCAAVLYSTHKHTAENPRYRLVVPLSRHVEPWEYEPICRRLADDTFGMDFLDHTTFELPRLFYWPSTSEDGEYVFKEQEGKPLDVEDLLASYEDPHDASEWPHGSNESVTLHRAMKKAGDPTEKNGLIGAFCRTYSIADAIDTFLKDVYDATAQEGRYTYKKGSVAGGLICYDGKFAFSHHDTDPASGQLCNAFDLVRIHLFGDRDEDSDAEDITKKPSYAAMNQFVAKDEKTCETIMAERDASAAEDFADFSTDEDDESERKERAKLMAKLEKHRKTNQVLSTIANILTVLEGDRKLSGKFWHDDFSSYDFADSMPWKRMGMAWNDKDDANLRVYLDRVYGIQGKEKISDCLDHVFSKHRRHPIRDYLKSLTWDETPRLDTLIIDYIGADDNDLNRAMTRKIFSAAVKRVFDPGCKFDYCLIMSGGEGIGKSTFLKIMGGDWFSDSIVTTEGKEGMESLRQAWIIELAELASIKRSDVEQTKNFLSKQEDCYRAAYGKRTNHYPRQCVFFGTTNELTFLKGDTGNRRFWVIPVDAGKRKIEGDLFSRLKEDRDQLWAEAVVRYQEGENLYLDTEQETAARERQKDYNIDSDDPTPGYLDEYLDTLLPADWYTWDKQRRRAFFQNHDPLSAESMKRTKFYAGEFIYEFLGMSENDKNYQYVAKKVNKLMKLKEEWEYGSIRISGYGKQKGYKKAQEE